MSNAGYARKKQPDLVRRSLLEHAARIAGEKGLAAVTVQAVATAAGVTKGGLFHHFPSKQALVEAMMTHLIERLDAEIDRHMAADPQPWGRFTRAYLQALMTGAEFGIGSPFDAPFASAMADPALVAMSDKWIDARLKRHAETDSDPILEIVRLAADGTWISAQSKKDGRIDVAALQDRLVAMTMPQAAR